VIIADFAFMIVAPLDEAAAATKKLNRRSFHIHLRGFFSSITPQVAAAVIPPSATSSKTSSGVPIGVILANSRSIDTAAATSIAFTEQPRQLLFFEQA
jgi:hypothetical protein